MESGHDEEGRTIDPAFVEPEAFVMEVPPFVTLDADKEASQQDGNEEPGQSGLALLHGNFRKVERHAARNEEDRVNARQLYRKRHGIRKRRPLFLRKTEDDVSTDETSEKHGLGGEEHDHAKSAGRLRGLRVPGVLIMG